MVSRIVLFYGRVLYFRLSSIRSFLTFTGIRRSGLNDYVDGFMYSPGIRH